MSGVSTEERWLPFANPQGEPQSLARALSTPIPASALCALTWWVAQAETEDIVAAAAAEDDEDQLCQITDSMSNISVRVLLQPTLSGVN